MDNPLDQSRYFFVGIGGSGMLPLALILHDKGHRIAGSDRSLDQHRLSGKFDFLQQNDIELFPQDGSGVRAGDIVVASTAVEETVPDIVAATRLGLPRLSRAQLLANLFNQSPCAIGVAGTSGKSTVTGMIGWILEQCGKYPTVMNGAVMKNFITVDKPFASALVGDDSYFVSEVDESDGSIALYQPHVAVLNNIGVDHKPLEELRQLFGDFIGKAQTAVLNFDNAETRALAAMLPTGRVLSFGFDCTDADLCARNLDEQPDGITFDLQHKDERFHITLNVPGRHNVSNALAAVGAACAIGVPLADAARAVGTFAGVRRRLERVGIKHGVTVIDDFGHNPDKIAVALDALHAFPGRVIAMFQPHGFGPLKLMRQELTETFVSRLRDGDLAIIVDPVYHGGTTSREVGSAEIAQDIVGRGAPALYIPDRNDALEHMVGMAQAADRLIVMGARDDTLSQFAHDLFDRLP